MIFPLGVVGYRKNIPWKHNPRKVAVSSFLGRTGFALAQELDSVELIR
jgi:hypothetical protein